MAVAEINPPILLPGISGSLRDLRAAFTGKIRTAWHWAEVPEEHDQGGEGTYQWRKK